MFPVGTPGVQVQWVVQNLVNVPAMKNAGQGWESARYSMQPDAAEKG